MKKFLISLIIVASCVNTSQSIADVNSIKSMNGFDTQVEFSNWEEIKKGDINISQKDIFELQQKQINYLEKAREETITNKIYKISLNVGDFALKMWNDPIIRKTIILPIAFYYGDIIIGKKFNNDFCIKLYDYLKEYCKEKFIQTEKLEIVNQSQNSNIKNNTWAQINKNYINNSSYLKYSIGVQQKQLKNLEQERNKGFFSRAWTGIKKVASSVKNGVVKAVKSAWNDNLFKKKLILPIKNLIIKKFTETNLGHKITNFAGPEITNKLDNYFNKNILGLQNQK